MVAVLPLLSVTVIFAEAVPLFVMVDVVGVAPVYDLPSNSVLYVFMVDPKAPVAVMVNFGFDLLCTMLPNVVWLVVVSATATLPIVGTTDAGTVRVKFFDTAEPILVLPEYVVTVTFAVPLVAFGMAFNQLVGMA